MDSIFEVIIVGGGPGGLAAAHALAKAGKKVALVENSDMGGICLNQGCIPTKFWLAAVAPVGLLHSHKRFGSLSGAISVDFEALQKRKERFVKGSSQAVDKSLRGAGVTVFSGRGAGTAPGVIEVRGKDVVTLRAKDIILATGSRSASFPGLVPDGDCVLDSDMTLALGAVPKSLLIIGAGAIGIEFSDFFASLGSEVTVIEGMPRLVPAEDRDIGEELRKILEKSGRKCIIGRKVASVASKDGQAELRFEDGEILTAEKAIVAVGRKANTQGLGVEALGGALDAGGNALVDASLRIAPHCYAIGDMNGRTLLAHAATHQGTWAARHILGLEGDGYDAGPVPSCIFGHVEIMRAGKTAREAAASGAEISVSKAPFSTNPIAQANGSSLGFAKAVWEGERLAGMAAIGYGAAHLVTAAQQMVLGQLTRESLHSFMFAHPTLDEILESAMLAPRQPYRE